MAKQEGVRYATEVSPGLGTVLSWLHQTPEARNHFEARQYNPVAKDFSAHYHAASRSSGNQSGDRLGEYVHPIERGRALIEHAAVIGVYWGKNPAALEATRGLPLATQASIETVGPGENVSQETLLALAHLVAAAQEGFDASAPLGRGIPRTANDHLQAGLTYLAKAVVQEEAKPKPIQQQTA